MISMFQKDASGRPRLRNVLGHFELSALTSGSKFMFTHTSATTDNVTAASADVWSDVHVCDHLGNITDVRVRATCGIDLFLPPFLFVIGLISNVLVVLVMRSKSFRSLSTSFYMIVNAVTDTSSILVALPIHYIFVNVPHAFAEIRHAHAMCSFFNVFGWGTSDLGILYTVAMTTERAIAIKYPLKAYKLCTTRRAKFVVVGLTIFEFVKVSHLILKSRIVTDTNSRLCDIDQDDAEYLKFYHNVWPWLHLSILVVSYSIVVAGNVVIFVNIRRSSQGDTTGGVGSSSLRRNFPSGSKNKQLSLMLMIDSCTLVVCTFPFAVISIISSQSADVFDLAGGKNLAYTVTFYLLYVNRCLNLFLYCVSGARFRDSLKDICLAKTRALILGRSVSRHERSSSVCRELDGGSDGCAHEIKCTQHNNNNNNNKDFVIFKMAASSALQHVDNLITSSPIYLTSLSQSMAADGSGGMEYEVVSTHL